MLKSFTSDGLNTTPQGAFIVSLLRRAAANPLMGCPVYHFRAKLAEPTSFVDGTPNYLGASPGDFATGIEFEENPNNPLRGVFCQPKRQPIQDAGGIYLQSQAELYLFEDIGEVFTLDEAYPKRQDKFDIQGVVYYAIAPAQPCQIGETVAAYKIELNRERYPVRPDQKQ